MASRDEVLIKIRMQGGKAAAAEIASVDRSVDGLGRSSSRAGGMMRRAGGAVGGLASQASAAAGKVAKLTAATAALGGSALAVKAARAGAEYNKMQDSQMVAFSTMLRSESKARALMGDIQALALKSPVLDPGSTGQAVQALLNYGMSAKRALPLVEALGDASAASGKEITEVMPQAALALGQIEGKGKLQAEELNQITEAVGINRKVLAKELGLTSEEFADAFKPGKGISAEKAIPAIQRALQVGSKGAAKRLSKTTAGQVDQLREVMSRELGKVTRPWYDAAGDTAGGIADIMGRKGLSGGQKISLSFDVAKKEFGPLVRQAEQAFRDAKIGPKIADGIEEYSPKIVTAIANGIVAGAPRIAGAAARAFGDMGTWGKLLTVAFLLRRFNVPVWGAAGKVLGAAMGRSAAASAAGKIGADGAITGKIGGRMGPIGTKLGRMLGTSLGAGAVALAAPLVAKGLEDALSSALGVDSDQKKQARNSIADPLQLQGHEKSGGGPLNRLKDAVENGPLGVFFGRANGGTVQPGETTLVGERGPEIARFPPGTKIIPNHALGRQRPQSGGQASRRQASRVVRETPVHLYLDGKVFYKAMSRETEIEALAH